MKKTVFTILVFSVFMLCPGNLWADNLWSKSFPPAESRIDEMLYLDAGVGQIGIGGFFSDPQPTLLVALTSLTDDTGGTNGQADLFSYVIGLDVTNGSEKWRTDDIVDAREIILMQGVEDMNSDNISDVWVHYVREQGDDNFAKSIFISGKSGDVLAGPLFEQYLEVIDTPNYVEPIVNKYFGSDQHDKVYVNQNRIPGVHFLGAPNIRAID